MISNLKIGLQSKLKYNIHTYKLTKIQTNWDIKVYKLKN